ncbi:MAG: RNA 2'-phosphotransferase, partial [Anaerolineae bacterium]|nr:RNA 2'-phosphotransferase [Anaerolineae bacterium]
MNQKDVINLSKLMSLALRHDPTSFGLTPDDDGWVALEALLAGIAARPRWQWVEADHLRQVVATSDKQRFEMDGPHIRARYGHSRAARPRYQAVAPPVMLYHGTPRRNLAAIRQNGLKAMGRQFVHLSATPEMAGTVGRRRDTQPALLRIRAAAAHAAGIRFGTPSGEADTVYLVETVPPEFIEFPDPTSTSNDTAS